MTEQDALAELRRAKTAYQTFIRDNFEFAAEDCGTCPTFGACCTDRHFVNVHITRLEAVAIKQDHVNALERLGAAYSKAGRFKDALATFDQLKTFKGDAKSYNYFGESLLELDRAEEAINAFNTAVEMNSDFAKARYNLGRAELKKGNRDAALTQYELLRATNPDWADKLYVLIDP